MFYNLIKEYTEIPGPVGHEELVAERMVADWTPLCERVWLNKIGNVFAKVGGAGPKLLITAHLDEINLLVKSITDDGFCWLTHGTGGSEFCAPPNAAYVGQPVLVKGNNEYHHGHVGTTSGHVRSAAQRAQGAPAWDDFFLDLGLASRAEVDALGIRPGSPVIFDVATRRLGHHIAGKAMDDRVGLALMTQLARDLQGKELKYELYFAATVQEEIDLGGSLNITQEVDFDLAIALEIGLVGDIPTVKDSYMPTGLGRGPILVHKDDRIYYSTAISAKLEAAAKRIEQPLQHAVFHGYATDGNSLIRMGVPTALFTFPTRYTHSHYEMINEQDVVAMHEVMREMVLNG